jgi:dethiobiotin synthase
MKAIFVTGTDTDVGKTVISGGLIRMLEGYRKAAYWKPVQTGTLVSEDRRDLMELTQLPEERFLHSAYVFPDPVSPHLAAARWKKTIDPSLLVETFHRHAASVETLVVEGAGGVLVPLNDDTLIVDLIGQMKVPCLLVVEDKLGAINHSLLSLEALRRRDIDCLGFVLTKATGRWGNREAIERHSGFTCLSEIAVHGDARTLLSQVAADPGLRKVMDLPVVPV